MIVIIDYGVGNVRSIQNMLRRAGHEAVVSRESAILRSASKLILPGVGHFRYGMAALERLGLVDLLTARVTHDRVPILGICLGAQLMGIASEEGDIEGLGWVPFRNVRFKRDRFEGAERIPHMGWALTDHVGTRLFAGMESPSRFYYVHSYHFEFDDPAMVASTAEHGYRFASGFRTGNIAGVQFHPEKSHAYGLQLLRNFAAAPELS